MSFASPLDPLRTSSFRVVMLLLGVFAVLLMALLAVVFWRAGQSEVRRIDALILDEASTLARAAPQDVGSVVRTRVGHDARHIAFAGLFTLTGTHLSGNLQTLPDTMVADGRVRPVTVMLRDELASGAAGPLYRQEGRAVAVILPWGEMLVIGREMRTERSFGEAVLRDLTFATFPTMLLVVVLGAVLGMRTQRRVGAMHATLEGIMGGNLLQRLPTRQGAAGTGRRGDELDRLAATVNRMLDEIQRLVAEVKATGDDIAHDLRTPLTRVRARLERALRSSDDAVELHAAIARSIDGLDQAFAIITALLRLRELEHAHRLTGFSQVDLAEVLRLIEDLYQPVAEEKDIRLTLDAPPTPVHGDRDLLMEAVGNLVDNAIKFTPAGGRVEMRLVTAPTPPGPVPVAGPVGVPVGADARVRLVVRDTGPGIAAGEREAVFSRFYRSERTRQSQGTGLGLSLVAAIAKLHDAGVAVLDEQPGCAIILDFPALPAAG